MPSNIIHDDVAVAIILINNTMILCFVFFLSFFLSTMGFLVLPSSLKQLGGAYHTIVYEIMNTLFQKIG